MKQIFIIVCLLYLCVSQTDTEPAVEKTNLRKVEPNEENEIWLGGIIDWIGGLFNDPMGSSVPMISVPNTGGSNGMVSCVTKNEMEQYRGEETTIRYESATM